MQLITEKISKYFADNRIFKNINFQIKSGQSLAIVGPNGSGKSTLIHILSNLIQPTEGKVIYKNTGGEIKKDNIYKYIGLVGPYLELYQDLSAKENLTFFSKIKGIRESDKRINDLMKRLKLSGREDDLVKAYSSGMKQRLKYVFALLSQPEVLFIDEPCANLDEEGIETVYEILAEQKKDKILIIATNDSDDLRFADWTVAVNV
jgi:heme exporter protein A